MIVPHAWLTSRICEPARPRGRNATQSDPQRLNFGVGHFQFDGRASGEFIHRDALGRPGIASAPMQCCGSSVEAMWYLGARCGPGLPVGLRRATSRCREACGQQWVDATSRAGRSPSRTIGTSWTGDSIGPAQGCPGKAGGEEGLKPKPGVGPESQERLS